LPRCCACRGALIRRGPPYAALKEPAALVRVAFGREEIAASRVTVVAADDKSDDEVFYHRRQPLRRARSRCRVSPIFAAAALI